MAKFLVKTNPLNEGLTCRTLKIEADKFELSNSFTYDFYAPREEHKERRRVASLPAHGVFLVVKEEALTDDFLDNPEDEDEDECPDIFEFIRSLRDEDDDPDEVEPVPVPQTPTAVPDVPKEEFPIEKWKDRNGLVWWGFHTPGGFVYFSAKSYAEYGRQQQIDGVVSNWDYLDLTGATKLEDDSE